MKIIDCPQRSDEWYAVRLGKVTGSHFAEVMNKKSGRETYMMRVLAERLTGQRYESYTNKNTEDGIEKEPDARDHYSWAMDVDVVEVGFVELSEDVGCSPDGFVGKDGLLEIKCPIITTHLKYILRNTLPSNYKPQVQGQLWICERQWCDFVSYNPEYMKKPIWITRVTRDEEYIKLLAASTAAFVTELKELEEKL